MKNTGLDEVWPTVYARKTLLQMMEWKAYTRALGAYLLKDATLHLALLNNNPNDTDADEDNKNRPDN